MCGVRWTNDKLSSSRSALGPTTGAARKILDDQSNTRYTFSSSWSSVQTERGMEVVRTFYGILTGGFFSRFKLTNFFFFFFCNLHHNQRPTTNPPVSSQNSGSPVPAERCSVFTDVSTTRNTSTNAAA